MRKIAVVVGAVVVVSLWDGRRGDAKSRFGG